MLVVYERLIGAAIEIVNHNMAYILICFKERDGVIATLAQEGGERWNFFGGVLRDGIGVLSLIEPDGHGSCCIGPVEASFSISIT